MIFLQKRKIWRIAVVLCCSFTVSAFEIAKDRGNIIVVERENPRDPGSISCSRAANELAQYLKQITGTEIPVRHNVEEKDIQKGGIIFIGPSFANDTDPLSPGEYRIKTKNGNLHLYGNDSKYGLDLNKSLSGETGTQYAVYAFLMKFGGVRWLWPGKYGTVIPAKAAIVLQDVNISDAPKSFVRQLKVFSDLRGKNSNGKYVYYVGKHHNEFNEYCRHLFCGSSRRIIGGHYGDAYLSRNEFDAHPEYMSMIEGKRKKWFNSKGISWQWAGQYCVSNPEVQQKFADNIVAKAAAMSTTSPIFNLTPNDGGLFCMCPECKKMDGNILPWIDDFNGHIKGRKYNEKAGWASNLSERIWKFNQIVAKKVMEKNPDIMLTCLAYIMYYQPPETIEHLPDNLMVMIADGGPGLQNGTPDEYEKQLAVFRAWHKKCRYLGYYGYFYNCIGSRAHTIGRMMKDLQKNGVVSYRIEPEQTFGAKWLDYVLFCKGMWNAEFDVDAVIDDYLSAAYGPAKEIMRKYHALSEATLEKYNSINMKKTDDVINNWTPEVRRALSVYLNEALKLTKNTEYENRIEFIKRGWEFLDSYAEFIGAMKRIKEMGFAVPDSITAGKNITVSLEEASKEIRYAMNQWQRFQRVMKNNEADEAFAVPYYSTGGWGYYNPAASLGITIENHYKAFNSENSIALPVNWHFKADPANKGIKDQWFSPETPSKDWELIRTDTCWEKQGYGKDKYPGNGADGYNGAAWYRIDVDIPATKRGAKVFLELGAVDESFTAYVNGTEVKTFEYDKQTDKAAWEKPHTFEITGAVEFGKKNLIAVEVRDKAGNGGIWKPCFIHFKPSDDKRSPSAISLDFTGTGEWKWGIAHKGNMIYFIKDNTLLTDGQDTKDILILNNSAMSRNTLTFKNGEKYIFSFDVRREGPQPPAGKFTMAVRLIVQGKELTESKAIWHTLVFSNTEFARKQIILAPSDKKAENGNVSIFIYGPGKTELRNITLLKSL